MSQYRNRNQAGLDLTRFGQPRKRRVNITLSPAAYRAGQQQARKQGTTLSGLIAKLLLRKEPTQ